MKSDKQMQARFEAFRKQFPKVAHEAQIVSEAIDSLDDTVEDLRGNATEGSALTMAIHHLKIGLDLLSRRLKDIVRAIGSTEITEEVAPVVPPPPVVPPVPPEPPAGMEAPIIQPPPVVPDPPAPTAGTEPPKQPEPKGKAAKDSATTSK